MTQDISLLNTAIGPVMRGPSSSHSAAPYMIGRTVRDLTNGPHETIISVDVRFDPAGSFAEVYRGQGSDEGFAAGLSGVAITSEAYKDALPKLWRREGDFQFDISIGRLERNNHPNRVDLQVTVRAVNGDVRQDRVEAVSLGGGTFEVNRLNDVAIKLDGTSHAMIIEHSSADTKALLDRVGRTADLFDWTIGERLVELHLGAEAPDELLDEIATWPGIIRVRRARPTQAVIVDRGVKLLGATHLIRQLGPGGDLADYALQYERQRLGVSTSEIDGLFDDRVAIMMRSVEDGFGAQRHGMKYIEPSARKVQAAAIAEPLQHGFLKTAIAAALAAMEQTTNRGVVCAAPTAGSAGIVPGTLFSVRAMGADAAQMRDFLKIASLVGALFAVRGSYAAELGGCSVETGASAAMAAAGLAHFCGGTPEQIIGAASLCLMNTLGLVCDPVGGEIEIPCHARNIAGIGHVWSSTTAVLAGFDAVIPFDELVEQTVKIGAMMHPDLRCTARGGCAATPTALKLTASARSGSAGL